MGSLKVSFQVFSLAALTAASLFSPGARAGDSHSSSKPSSQPERRFAFLIEPSSKGVAGESLSIEPWLVSVSRSGNPDFKSLDDIQVAAFSDASCTIPASGELTVKDFGLLTRVGIAIFYKLTDTAAGKTYFKFSAKNVSPACSDLVTLSPSAPETLSIVAGDGQTGALGTALPIPARVKVADAYGNAVGGIKISFKAQTAGGSVSPSEVSSDGSGFAASTLTLGQTPGVETFTASFEDSGHRERWHFHRWHHHRGDREHGKVKDDGDDDVVIFTETAKNPEDGSGNAPTQLGLNGPAAQAAGSCATLTVTLLNKSGQAASTSTAQSFTLTGLGNGALYSDSSCATPVAAGTLAIAASATQAVVYLKDTRAETLSLQAQASGLASSLIVSDAIKAGAASALGYSAQPSDQAIAGQAFAIQPGIRILDAFGNSVSLGSFAVTLEAYQDDACQVAAPDSGLTAATNPLDSASGSAAFSSVSLARAGTYYLLASADGLTSSCSRAIAVQAAAPSVITAVAGSRSGSVGSALQAQVKVTDAFGNSVAGAGLSFAVSSGGGSVSPSTALTDSSGNASATVILGTAPGVDLLQVSATSAGVAWAQAADSLPSISISDTATAGAPISLTVSGSASFAAGGCGAYLVALQDVYGNAATARDGVALVISGLAHGALYSDSACSQSLASPAVPAGTSQLQFFVADTTAESFVVSVDGTASGLGTGTLAVQVSAGAAAKLVFSAQPSGSTPAGALFATQPGVLAQDAFGNVVANASGQATLAAYSDAACSVAAGGSLQATANPVSLSGGGATFAGVSYPLAGALWLGVSVPGVGSVCTDALAITAGTPVSAVLSGPASQVAGACAGPFVLTLRDSLGNAAPAASGIRSSLGWSGSGSFFTDSDCRVSGSAISFPVGATAATFYFSDDVAESNFITASTTVVGDSAPLPFTVRAGAATQLAFSSQPSSTGVAGMALLSQPQAATRDRLGNTVSTASNSVTLAVYDNSGCTEPSSGSFSVSANPVATVSGIAAFSGVSYTKTGTIYLGITAPGLSRACSKPVQIIAGPAATIVATQGDAQSAVVGSNLPVNPTVKVSDAYGNVVFGEQVTFTVTAGGGNAGVSAATTDPSGLASTSFTLGNATGSQSLKAAIGAGSVVFTATATPRPPVALGLTGPSGVTAGACSQAYTVQLLDSTQSATVAQSATSIGLSGAGAGAFFADSGCGTPVSVLTIAAGAGSAQFFLGDTKAESLTLVAQSSGLGSTSASTLVSAGAATKLLFASQPSPTGTAGQALALQPTVSAQDAYGNTASSFAGNIVLSASSDAVCAGAATGILSATSNPVAASSGSATYAGVSYDAPGFIYLKASSSGLASGCSQRIILGAALTLAAGTAHTCALFNGGVKCWGFNNPGTLGNGNNTNASTPQQVVGLSSGVLAMGAGGQHSCAATATGISCWGLNAAGQLGNGGTTNSNVPVAVPGIGGGVSQIVGGDSHTCILFNGSVQCWGDNTFGQLGTGNTQASSLPVSVQGLPGAVSSIAAASDSTCAVLTTGSAYCWGFNDYGQLGDGTTQNSSVPVLVQGLPGVVTSIAPGIEDTCALVSGAVYCWGRNDSGQLGIGNFTSSMTPQKVQGFGTKVTTLLSGGQNFSCAILDTGAVQCWGQNTRGQLGDNRASGAQSALPVQVAGLTSGYQALHAGYIHACASDGAHIKCWGWGTSGQLGNGQTLQSNVPVSVIGY